MKSKNIYKTAIGLFALILFVSCGDDLEPEPAQSIEALQALSSSENIQATLVGAYDEIGVDDLFGGETLRNSELLGGDGEVRWAGTFNAPREMFNKNMQTVNGDAAEVWLESYQTINIINNVLSALDIIEDQAERDRVEGEAKFIRALLYFELVRFYGKPYVPNMTNDQLGVPLILEPTLVLSEDDNVSRNTVQEVYTQIFSDLNDAIENLPASNSVFATSGAALALRARVNLQVGNFPGARDDANAVITSGGFVLLSNFSDNFNRDANSGEDIFAIQVTSQDGANAMNTFFATPQFGGRDGDIEILDGHVNLYPAGDDRGAMFYVDGALFTSKYTSQFANVPVIRLAEMYLIRAETNEREGTAVGDSPINDINRLRSRANAPEYSTLTLADIVLERRLELAFEGHKIHDIKRLQQSVGSFAYDANELVFPIPQRERNANGNLQQNDGYGE